VDKEVESELKYLKKAKTQKYRKARKAPAGRNFGSPGMSKSINALQAVCIIEIQKY
jgi:hypothetical protein